MKIFKNGYTERNWIIIYILCEEDVKIYCCQLVCLAGDQPYILLAIIRSVYIDDNLTRSSLTKILELKEFAWFQPHFLLI